MRGMAMGKHRERQASLWVTTIRTGHGGGHPFYTRLNELLEQDFDDFAETECARFYAETIGRPSDAGNLLPAAADWLFRGHRFGARHRLAGR